MPGYSGKIYDFFSIDEIPEGKSLTVRYERTVGIYKGEVYKRTLDSTEELKRLQKHLSSREDSMDALIRSDGFKYRVLKIKWN